jgi:hypothetical protein
MWSGLYSHNTGVFTTATGIYYNYIRMGKKDQQLYSLADQWQGPYEFDLARKAGLAHTPIPAASQPYAGQSASIRIGWDDTNYIYTSAGRGDGSVGVAGADDLQAFTGDAWCWLPQFGVKVSYHGKYQNGAGQTNTSGRFSVDDPNGALARAKTTRFVRPGITDYYCTTDDYQDHYHYPMCEFSGANPGDGDGAVGVATYYDYDRDCVSATWAGGILTVTLAGDVGYTRDGSFFQEDLVNGEEIVLDGFTPTAINGIYTVSSVNVGAKQFTVNLAVNPGATTVVGKAYPKKFFSEQRHLKHMLQTLSNYSDTDSFLLNYCPRMPHGSLSHDGFGADDETLERRYFINGVYAVTQGQALRWNGVSGAVSPATYAPDLTALRYKMFQNRMCMLASADDVIKTMLDTLDARFGTDGYIVIFLSDNGYQYGEKLYSNPTNGTGVQEDAAQVWSNIGGNVYPYDGSLRIPYFMRHPAYPAQNYEEPCWVGDTALTLMDIFGERYDGLKTHHAHTKRDGYSLIRLLNNPGDPVHDRAIAIRGIYHILSVNAASYKTGIGICTRNHRKFIKRYDNDAERERHDMTRNPSSPYGASTDWETTNLDSGVGDSISNQLSVWTDDMKVCRFDAITQTSNVRTARVV